MKAKTKKESPSSIFRKQVTFPEKRQLTTIAKAVDIINRTDEFGGSLSVNHFIAKNAYERAKEIVENGGITKETDQ